MIDVRAYKLENWLDYSDQGPLIQETLLDFIYLVKTSIVPITALSKPSQPISYSLGSIFLPLYASKPRLVIVSWTDSRIKAIVRTSLINLRTEIMFCLINFIRQP